MMGGQVDIYSELLGVTAAMDAARVNYALCGGLALGLHGRARATKDIDLLVRKKDIAKAKAAVASLGFVLEAAPMTFRAGTENETRVHRVSKVVGDDLFMLDLLEVEPRNAEVWKGRMRFKTQDGPITAVSREGLIIMKRRAGRPQDLADLHWLEGGEDAQPG